MSDETKTNKVSSISSVKADTQTKGRKPIKADVEAFRARKRIAAIKTKRLSIMRKVGA